MEKRNNFKQKYKIWVKSSARDTAFVLKNLDYNDLIKIKRIYKQYSEDSSAIFFQIQDKARFDTLFGDRLEGIVLLETEAVVFSSSIFSDTPEIFDYALAMNRKYFIRGLWFSIIALNSSYIKQANDIMLTYTLEHELLQKKLYEENIKQNMKRFTPEEKRQMNLEARRMATDISGIGEHDLLSEKELMLTLSRSCPLIPNYFADIALFLYVEAHWEQVKHFGIQSKNEWEKQLGEKMNMDFQEWLVFSDEVFNMFYREVGQEMEEYGYV